MKRTGTTPWRRHLPVATTLLPLLPLLPLLSGCGSGNRTIPVPSATPTPVPVTTPSPSATPTPTPVVSGSLKPPYANKVVFVSQRNASERDQLYVMNPDGSQVTALTQLANIDEGNFNLLYPDTHYMNAAGTKFLLTFDASTGAGTSNILVNSDGTGETNITALLDPTTTSTGNASIGHVSDVSMNAAGTQFVFPYTSFAEGGDFLPHLVTVNTDGTARTTRYTAPDGQEIISPIFAPDGQTIYFVQGTSGGSSPFPFTGGIYRLAAGATTPTLVTSFTTKGSVGAVDLPSISISADGTKIAFANNVSGLSDEIFTVNSDGTGLKQLTTAAALNVSPAFTADGAKIIFVSYRDGNAEIYNINPDGTGETRLTYEIEPDTQPATRAAKLATSQRHRAAIIYRNHGNANSRKAAKR